MVKHHKRKGSKKPARTVRTRKGARKHSKKMAMNPSPFGKDLVVRPRFFTKAKSCQSGYFSVGTLKAAGSWFSIAANAFYEPYTAGSFQNATACGGTDAFGSTNTQNVIGFSTMANLYSVYKVHGARLKLRVSCVSASDVLITTVIPMSGNQYSGTVFPLTSLNVEEGQDNVKTVMVTNQQGPKTIQMYQKSTTVCGLTKLEYDASPMVSMAAQPSGTNAWFFLIQFNNLSGLTNTGLIYAEWELEQYVECAQTYSLLN